MRSSTATFDPPGADGRARAGGQRSGSRADAAAALAAAAVAAGLAWSGLLQPLDRLLLDLLDAPGAGAPPQPVPPSWAAGLSAALVLVPALLTRGWRSGPALAAGLLLPALVALALLWRFQLWLGPMAALTAAKLPAVLRLVRQRRLARSALRRERDRAWTVLETIDEAVLGIGRADGRVRFANAAAERLLGATGIPLPGRRWDEALPLREPVSGRQVRDLPALLAPEGPRLLLLARADDPRPREVRLLGRDLPRGGGGPADLLVALSDVSEISRLNASLVRSATHDGLTGLPNRELAREQIDRALARARRQGEVVAVLVLDLDGFKHVNDALGHGAGDALLREVGERLAGACRKHDLVARLGGDEFLVVVEQLPSREAAAGLVGKLLTAFDPPFAAAGQELPVGASVGASLFPGDGGTHEELLRAADVAMHAAKREGAGLRFFTSDLDAPARDQLRLRRSLAQALARGEFSVHYQLRVGLRDLMPAGFEALLRWREGERGFIPPALFVPVAESAGLIEPITRFVLRAASAECRGWRAASLGHRASVAVNISARHLLHGDLVAEVAVALAEAGLEPAALTLELTESTLVRDPERAIAQLRALKAMGVKLAVDDFGTGYSSLAYLRDLPVDTVKIDRAFVAEIGRDRRHEAIVAAIVRLAEGLGFGTVAEGVETAEQVAFLRDVRCEEAQGYLFAKPVPPEGIADVLRALAATRAALG